MKLATLKSNSRDGRLVVVSDDNTQYLCAQHIAPNLLYAIENWSDIEPKLAELASQFDNDNSEPNKPFDYALADAPLPRSWQWLDGSAFPQHGILMQQAYNMPPLDPGQPLMYQGMSNHFYGPNDAIPIISEKHGIDFEGELGVIVDDVPMGTSAKDAMAHIKLIVQINDWSLRSLGPVEMKTGFGFIQAKPPCSMAAVALTPDELGPAWQDGQVHLPLQIDWNSKRFGNAVANEMEYGFHELVAHAAKTRDLVAGTIIGSGTVSNKNYNTVGSSCISERQAIDMIEFSEIRTPFMAFGDRVRMEVTAADGSPLFGPIDQQVIKHIRGEGHDEQSSII